MSSKAARRDTDYRNKKRRFHGNQHVQNKTLDPTASCSSSSSAKKVRLNYPVDENKTVSNEKNGYRIINIDSLISELSNYLICSHCKSKAVLKERIVFGLVSEFCIECNFCSTLSTFKSSPVLKSSNHDYEVNVRIIYAMRTVGLGLQGIKNFCTAMDMPQPVSQRPYDRILKNIKYASSEVAVNSMKKAANEEILASECNEICVSGDGTWKTRGHTSRIGVCSVIGDVTGKVIDVEVLSSYCKGCEKWNGQRCGTAYEAWKLRHESLCVKNHSGSSGKMEVDGMKKIFERSISARNVKYVKYIGDGDTKTFPELQSITPYTLQKVECVGHIQKRMGTRLRKLKLLNRGKKLSDGKGISGKNRLTDKLIDKFTTYYGNAIRGNSNSVQDMRKAIWAIYCHYRSRDEEPMHYFCPTDASSWCDYQKDVLAGRVSLYKHKNTVPISVMEKIKPVFTELSAPKLLKKCLGGKTQNSNESFNSTVWKYCPKTSGSSKIVADIATNEAVVMFNEGMAGRLNILKQLGCEIGQFSVTSALQADSLRIKKAEIKCKLSTLEARRVNRRKKKAVHERLKELEGATYEAGAF